MAVDRPAMVIGLDGATWKLLDRFVEEGVMPTLGRMRDEGARGPLWSVVPPMTATAWTSYQTGKGPGKHGIYDWTEPVSGSYLYRPIDSTRVQSRTLFELLSERGARVATVNLPLTWPAREINGVAVGDMLTPGKQAPGFTYPAEFASELDRLVPDYVIDTHLCDREDDVRPFLARLRAMLDCKGRLVRHLLEREPWDLFCCVWVEMDRMQHCLWHVFDERHPRFDARLAGLHRDEILDVYRLLDTRVAEMVERARPDTNVLFISDHGFGPCRYKVFLNTWLAQEGFLTFKEGGRAARGRLQRVRGALDRAGVDTRRLIALAKRLGGDAALRFGGDNLSRFAADIDWERTQAYCHGTNAIRLNLKGREARGSVDPAEADAVIERLRERLLGLRDPEGNRIVTGVLRREELYRGPEVGLAADLLIAHHDDSVWFYYSEGERPETIFEPSGWASGNHEPDGLFCAWGPDFRAGATLPDANIADILPTLFATMGVPVPDDVDGRVLAEVMTRRPRVRWSEARAFVPPEVERGGAADRMIEERLRGLGYLQ
ncbi:MAG: alkaline phosphatase family protein [Myxococcota bacterium]